MRQFLMISGLVLGIIVLGTVGIHVLTESPWMESLYLAVITLTTLGSRDVGTDSASMLFIIFYLMGGFSVFTYSAFTIGQVIVSGEIRRAWEKRKMEQNLSALKSHYIVCGIGRMGSTICEHLAFKKQSFVIVDTNRELLESFCQEHQWLYVHGDATDDEVLRQAGIERAKALATVLATDADNVYVVLSARLLSSSLQIVARASDESAILKLQRAGATRVISPFSSGGVKMARFMISPSIEDFLDITHGAGSELELAEVQIGSESRYVNQNLAQADLREQGLMVIGIRRANGEHIIAPEGSAVIHEGDSLFAFGTPAAVNELAKRCG